MFFFQLFRLDKFLAMMRKMNVSTIGEFAVLTGNEIVDLPIIPPKLQQAQDVLKSYQKENFGKSIQPFQFNIIKGLLRKTIYRNLPSKRSL